MLRGLPSTIAMNDHTPPADAPSVPARYAVIDQSRCSSCGECVRSCPRQAIEAPASFRCAKCVKYCSVFDVPCEVGRVAICVERCDGCGVCVPRCSSDAIRLRPVDASLVSP